MNKTTLVLSTAFLAAAIAGVSVAFAFPQKASKPIDHAIGRKPVELGVSPFRGSETGLVTIVEFVDYECGFCRKAELTMRALLERYPGKVRIQLAHNPLPFHPNAALAAAAVVAAGEQGKQWEMHDRMMAAKRIDRAFVEQQAAALGL